MQHVFRKRHTQNTSTNTPAPCWLHRERCGGVPKHVSSGHRSIIDLDRFSSHLLRIFLLHHLHLSPFSPCLSPSLSAHRWCSHRVNKRVLCASAHVQSVCPPVCCPIVDRATGRDFYRHLYRVSGGDVGGARATLITPFIRANVCAVLCARKIVYAKYKRAEQRSTLFSVPNTT